MTDQNKGLSYSDAGVDIDAGNELVERIKPSLKKTNRPGVLSAIGGFGGLFDLKAAGFKMVNITQAFPEGKGWTTRKNREWQPKVHSIKKLRWEYEY